MQYEAYKHFYIMQFITIIIVVGRIIRKFIQDKSILFYDLCKKFSSNDDRESTFLNKIGCSAMRFYVAPRI